MDTDTQSKADCENFADSDTQELLKYYEPNVDKFYVDFERLGFRVMAEPKRAPVLLPGEHQDIRVDVDILLSNGIEWLATPNTKFGGRRPQELIGTVDEPFLRETLRSAVYSGMA